MLRLAVTTDGETLDRIRDPLGDRGIAVRHLRAKERSIRVAGGTIQIPMPTFVLSSSAPANKLIGYTRGETLEELVEANSMIEESERAIQNQSITFVRTENTGYKLAFGDTRSIYNFGA